MKRSLMAALAAIGAAALGSEASAAGAGRALRTPRLVSPPDYVARELGVASLPPPLPTAEQLRAARLESLASIAQNPHKSLPAERGELESIRDQLQALPAAFFQGERAERFGRLLGTVWDELKGTDGRELKMRDDGSLSMRLRGIEDGSPTVVIQRASTKRAPGVRGLKIKDGEVRRLTRDELLGIESALKAALTRVFARTSEEEKARILKMFQADIE